MKKPENKTPPQNPTCSIREGIEKGEKDIREGKVFTHAEAKEKLKKWLNISSAN